MYLYRRGSRTCSPLRPRLSYGVLRRQKSRFPVRWTAFSTVPAATRPKLRFRTRRGLTTFVSLAPSESHDRNLFPMTLNDYDSRETIYAAVVTSIGVRDRRPRWNRPNAFRYETAVFSYFSRTRQTSTEWFASRHTTVSTCTSYEIVFVFKSNRFMTANVCVLLTETWFRIASIAPLQWRLLGDERGRLVHVCHGLGI